MIHMSRREFTRLVRQAYRNVPSPVKATLRNLDIAVEDWPDPEDLEFMGMSEGNPQEVSGGVPGEASLFGLYTGVPLPERQGAEPALPDRITIFRQPILRSCSSRSEAEREIRVTLLHEIGHFLGMTEEDLERLGYG